MNEFVKNTSKRLFVAVALFMGIIASGLLGGCTFDAEHNRAHWENFEQDMHESHRFIDKTFFNYDWDDPNNWYVEQ